MMVENSLSVAFARRQAVNLSATVALRRKTCWQPQSMDIPEGPDILRLRVMGRIEMDIGQLVEKASVCWIRV